MLNGNIYLPTTYPTQRPTLSATSSGVLAEKDASTANTNSAAASTANSDVTFTVAATTASTSNTNRGYHRFHRQQQWCNTFDANSTTAAAAASTSSNNPTSTVRSIINGSCRLANKNQQIQMLDFMCTYAMTMMTKTATMVQKQRQHKKQYQSTLQPTMTCASWLLAAWRKVRNRETGKMLVDLWWGRWHVIIGSRQQHKHNGSKWWLASYLTVYYC
jgi:hypothetical protein